ncbi:Ubiquitin-conjugating enzyme E2 H [Blattella germanica]|nr:Ubiquitin-conjugating enzyme E2 H [Blattella germanica]
MKSKHEVTILSGIHDLCVKFHGPEGTLYEGGIWKVHITLTQNYPFSPPTVRFLNPVYHPNIDKATGTVCLNALSHDWSPLYDLSNIFESFLPQLLTYPNPSHPMNLNAAALYMSKPEDYDKKVRNYVRKYAGAEALEESDSSSSDSSLSDSGEMQLR